MIGLVLAVALAADGGAMDAGMLAARIQRELRVPRYCVEKATLRSGVKVSFTVQADGTVSEVEPGPAGLPAAVGDCLKAAIAKSKFTPPGEKVRVSVPIVYDAP